MCFFTVTIVMCVAHKLCGWCGGRGGDCFTSLLCNFLFRVRLWLFFVCLFVSHIYNYGMHISQLWNKEAIDGLLARYSVASVSHEWPWTGSLKSHDQLALEQRLLWLCMPMRELQSLPAAVAALESGVCTWSL